MEFNCVSGAHDNSLPEGSRNIKWCRRCGALCVIDAAGREQWHLPVNLGKESAHPKCMCIFKEGLRYAHPACTAKHGEKPAGVIGVNSDLAAPLPAVEAKEVPGAKPDEGAGQADCG